MPDRSLVTSPESASGRDSDRYSAVPGRAVMALTEARRIVAEHECRQRGCSWDVVQTLERPVAVVCSSCGRAYDVAPTAADRYVTDVLTLCGHMEAEGKTHISIEWLLARAPLNFTRKAVPDA